MDSQILIFGLFAAVVIAVVAICVVAAAKRRAELAAWAMANGFEFSEERDYSFDSRYPMYGCLRRGSRRYAYNIMRGPRGIHHVVAFDYHYETYSVGPKGQTQTHHHYFSAVIMDSPWMLKPLFIRPEGFFDKITEFFGADDIDFELDAFSRAFYVKAPDRQWAFDVIQQDTMEFLLSQPRFSIEMEGEGLIVWKSGTMNVATLSSALGVAEGILKRLPRYLINELKGV